MVGLLVQLLPGDLLAVRGVEEVPVALAEVLEANRVQDVANQEAVWLVSVSLTVVIRTRGPPSAASRTAEGLWATTPGATSPFLSSQGVPLGATSSGTRTPLASSGHKINLLTALDYNMLFFFLDYLLSTVSGRVELGSCGNSRILLKIG